MKCANCETTGHKKLYEDPCDAPIEEGECICHECRGNFLYDLIDEAEQHLAGLQEIYKAEHHSGR